ncbi:ABC transporter ATP-binding protein [Pseudomonas aeruginosa]|nr:ABC transporter ATP-binding protein [Pseudomonas aeruginosa]
MRFVNTLPLIFGLTAALGSSMALALPSDREQPIRVQADSAELDDKQGVAVYRGDVVVTQGSTKLTGNTVTLKQDKNGDIEVVTSVGKPAYYEQKPAPDKDVTKAYGLTIQYFRHAEPGRADRPGQGDPGRQHLRRREDRLRHPAPDRQRGSCHRLPGDQPAPAHRHGHPAEEKGPVMATLKAQHLAKSYKGRQVVRDVSMSIDSGQIVGLLGPNGAGKTTCFYMIVGLVQADQGVVRIDEQNVTHLPMHGRARAGIGYLPQEASIFRKLSVSDNIMAILETRSDLDRNGRKEALEGLLQEFHIHHIRDNLGMSLSGGERRRVEIARALASAPKFILLDEPFAGVDPISVGDIKQIIHHLKAKGIGILITDHNVRETLDICETAYIVNDGQLIAEGDAESILANDLVKEVYLGHEFRL